MVVLDGQRVHEQSIGLPSAGVQSAPRPHVSAPAPGAAETVSEVSLRIKRLCLRCSCPMP